MRPGVLDCITLYNETVSGNLDTFQIASFLSEKFGAIPAEVSSSHQTDDLDVDRINRLANDLAGAKIANPMSHWIPEPPLYGEIEYEKRVIKNISKLTYI